MSIVNLPKNNYRKDKFSTFAFRAIMKIINVDLDISISASNIKVSKDFSIISIYVIEPFCNFKTIQEKIIFFILKDNYKDKYDHLLKLTLVELLNKLSHYIRKLFSLDYRRMRRSPEIKFYMSTCDYNSFAE